jgi:hypothetical protein
VAGFQALSSGGLDPDDAGDADTTRTDHSGWDNHDVAAITRASAIPLTASDERSQAAGPAVWAEAMPPGRRRHPAGTNSRRLRDMALSNLNRTNDFDGAETATRRTITDRT